MKIASSLRNILFADLFGRLPAVTASAPGRVNCMGDHTDYNGGYVLPVVIPYRTMAQISPRKDLIVRAYSRERSLGTPHEYVLGEETNKRQWIDYVQGVTYVLAKGEYPISGFDLLLSTDIPIGSGLSSSAALEIALLRGLRELFGLSISDVELAQLGQLAETDFVGAPVGIMDQMAASLGKEQTALFLDTRTLRFEQIALPEDCEIVIIDSGIAHSHRSGGYKERRIECTKARALLNVAHLTDAALEEIGNLPFPLNCRARHVVTENERVKETVAAFQAQDLKKIRSLFYASHDSLRTDFMVSLPEIDVLVEYSKQAEGIVGARLTGGGFGGCVVMLAHKEEGIKAAQHIIERTVSQFKFRPTLILPVV